MNIRNCVYKSPLNDVIDCEIEHSQHGWIPTTIFLDGSDDRSDLVETVKTLQISEYIEPVRLIYIPKSVTMRQARLALLELGLLQTVSDAIANGADESLKIEWEYALDVKREWPSLIALATTLGLTSDEIDDIFKLAATK